MTRNLPQLAPTIFIASLAAAIVNPKPADDRPMRNVDRIEAPAQSADATTSQSTESGGRT